MKAKEYLKQIEKYQIIIEQLTREIQNLKIIAAASGSKDNNPDKVQASRVVEDKMAMNVATYVDLENELQIKRWEYATLKCQIIKEIHELEDCRYMQILYLHYVFGKRLEEIACIMHKSNGEPYSYDHINKLHGEALIEFQKIIT